MPRLEPELTANRAVRHLDGVDHLWIHVDVDVLSTDVMPAVDSPQPDGMSFEELEALLVPLLANPRAAGLEVTIYDPDLDPDGRCGRALTDFLVRVFRGAGLGGV